MTKSSLKQQQQQQGHISTVHQRLYHALNLGLRSFNDGGRKWHFVDVEIQRLVIRSIDAFLDCISAETLKYTLVKGSIPDMVGALGGILHLKNEATLSLASNIAVKMINILPITILQPHILELIRPLASLLPSHQLQVAISCAAALNMILSNLSSKKEKEVWEILQNTDTVVHIAENIQDFSAGSKPTEYFKVMISLLSKILWRWPPSRFCIWSNVKLMEVLGAIVLSPDFLLKVAVLQLYTALALCCTGAQKLLEKKATVMYIVEHCIASSNSISVQMEGLKFAQSLAINEQEFLKMMKICCEGIVRAIINVMSNCRSHSGKVPKDQMFLLVEAYRLALITRWSGEHHKYFWKLGIEKVLLNLLLNNFHISHQSPWSLSLEEQIAVAQQGLVANFLLETRPYIWDIVGGLAAHCSEDFRPQENELTVNLLVTCVCLNFMESVQNSRQVFHSDLSELCRNESASRAVLMLIYSPSKYISHQARSVLSEILGPYGTEYATYLLGKLKISRNKFGMLDNLQTVTNLMSLACYSALPQCRENVIKGQGIKTLVTFMRWCLNHDILMKKSNLAPHLHNSFSPRTCCWVHTEGWDGEDSPLLYCLWSLAELMHHSGCVRTLFSGQVDYSEAQLVSELHRVCIEISAPAPRWYAACILSYFGYYGFPNKLGKRIGEALNEKELSDVKLFLTDAVSLSVHGVILMVRCPSLLPSEKHPLNDRSSNGCFTNGNAENCERSKREVRLSSHVDHQALLKLLEYIYAGYFEAKVELVKKLKTLARHCNLHYLLQMLCHKSPRWGTPFPSFDFTFALGPEGHSFSDIILEGKANDQFQCSCSTCSLLIPHVHVHKVMLWSSSDYFRALFRSGMQESHSETIKVPVSWKALEKLVHWFYSDVIPKPISGCSWDNMDIEEKLCELHPYVELCWLAELWLLDDVHKECTEVIVSCLDSAKQLSIKIIQIAADLSQWSLAEAAANYMAPLYQILRNTGELEELDEEIVDMVRAASVRLSQEGIRHSS